MPVTTPPVFRFAPSPNGALHLGHAFSALLNFQAAQALCGRFLLRIEDIDQTRCTPELEANMLADLKWLGLNWEEPVRRQSDFFGNYQKTLNWLEREGLTYRSTLSRGDIKRIVADHEKNGGVWPRDPDGAPHAPGVEYEGQSDKSPNFAIRLNMKKALERVGTNLCWREFKTARFENFDTLMADPSQWGDVILARRDAPTSYHLSVVLDDADQKISHIVRGNDLKQSTAVHLLLQKLLGLPHPVYHHHDLILHEEGKKLAKSNQDTSLDHLKKSGATVDDIKKMIGI